jgi:hypothetical protein
MFDGKYNDLLDSMWFRMGVFAIGFVAWAGFSFELLKAW